MEPVIVRTIGFLCPSVVKFYALNDFSTWSAYDISALCNQVIYQFYFEMFNTLSYVY